MSDLLAGRKRGNLRVFILLLIFLSMAPLAYVSCGGGSGDDGSQGGWGVLQVADLSDNARALLELNDAGQLVWVVKTRADSVNINIYKDGHVQAVGAGPGAIAQFSLSDKGALAWVRQDGNQAWLYYFDGQETFRLTEDDEYPCYPDVNDHGQVSCVINEKTGFKVFLFEDGLGKRLSNSDHLELLPLLNDQGQVFWQGLTGEEFQVYLYSGGETNRISSTPTKLFPEDPNYGRQINDLGQIVWVGRGDGGETHIYLWNGKQAVRLDDFSSNRHPVINNAGQVAWQGFDGRDWEIFLYHNGAVTRVTDNNEDDVCPMINDQGYLVWQGWRGTDFEIFVHAGGVTARLTDNDINDLGPVINNLDQVAWYTRDWKNNYVGLFLAEKGGASGLAAYLEADGGKSKSGDDPGAKAEAKNSSPDSTGTLLDVFNITPTGSNDYYSFVVMGDSRGLDHSWAPWTTKFPYDFLDCLRATIIRRFNADGKLQMVFFNGDMVTTPFGACDFETPGDPSCDVVLDWDYSQAWKGLVWEYWYAVHGKRTYLIMGNHEGYFFTPPGVPWYFSYLHSQETFAIQENMAKVQVNFGDDVHMFSIFNQFKVSFWDKTTDGVVDDTQVGQFKALLESGLPHNTKFIFTLGHAPITDSGNTGLKTLMLDHDVSAYFCGHVHLYVRTDLSYKTSTPKSLAQFTIGNAGTESADPSTKQRYENNADVDNVALGYCFAYVRVYADQAEVRVYMIPYDNILYDHCFPDDDWVLFEMIVVYPDGHYYKYK